MSHSLAVRAATFGSLEPGAGSSLTRVREVLDSLATRDVDGDVLTAVRLNFQHGSTRSSSQLTAPRVFASSTRIKPAPPKLSMPERTLWWLLRLLLEKRFATICRS
jgi:hypothetical protein